MPILPLIDLLILLAWTALGIGAFLKVINLALGHHWQLVGLAPMDMLMIAGILLTFALTLIGRTWVKANEPGLLASQRADATREAYASLRPEPAEEAPNEAAPADGAGWQTRPLDT